jgi:glutaredoxin
MNKSVILAVALSLAAAQAGAAQLYRWVDEKGNVEWRDTPPPPSAKKVEQRKLGVSTIQTSELPYSVQQAIKNHPVTLWITDCGDVCTRARAHLNRRGVPHTERNAQAEIEAFKKVTGGGLEVPLLVVGSRQVKGYLEGDWDAALDAAGYPKTPVAGFKPPPPAPAPKDAATGAAAVKLYVNAQCTQCNEARELLGSRGVKFQEVTAGDILSIAEIKNVAAGNPSFPVLVVGKFVVPGFDPPSYHKALDESGYKRTP